MILVVVDMVVEREDDGRSYNCAHKNNWLGFRTDVTIAASSYVPRQKDFIEHAKLRRLDAISICGIRICSVIRIYKLVLG